MIMTQSFATGRNYGRPQIIKMEFQAPAPDADPFDNVDVVFTDASRGIAGKVRVFVLDITYDTIGFAVMDEYDFGRYEPV